MNFSGLISLFYDKLQEVSTNTAFSAAKVKKWLNEGYVAYLNSCNWSFLIKEEELHNVFTTCAVQSAGITLYPESTIGMTKGMKLRVYKGGSYEQVEIESVSGSAIILKSPGLEEVYPVGSVIVSPQIFLPHDCGVLLSVSIMYETCGNSRLICCSSSDSVVARNGCLNGKPKVYVRMGRNGATEGYPAGLTAQAGTGSPRVVMSSGFDAPDNWYAGWNLINTTRNTVSRVTEYKSESKILELSPVSVSQTAGDSFYLRADLDQIFVYPVPDRVYRLFIRYCRICPELAADTDIAQISSGGDSSFIADYALGEAFLADKKPEMASVFRQKFNSALENLKSQDLFPPDCMPGFRGWR